jgi:hypothetical protein
VAATNGLGWVVEQFIREQGWTAITPPFPSKEEAEGARDAHFPKELPLRVYEGLDHPNYRNA